ncbi:MAG: fluoride efflux transporter CrcB [Nitrospinota bacterium]
MLNALLVGIGGFIGSLCRYLVTGLVYRGILFADFPYATLIVNVTGCFFFGVLHGIFETRQVLVPELRVFLFIGVLGGFTTFSTFGFETFVLARDREFLKVLGNIFSHILLGLGAVWAGTNLVSGVLQK